MPRDEPLHPSHHSWSPVGSARGPPWTHAQRLKTPLAWGIRQTVLPATPSASFRVAAMGRLGAKPSAYVTEPASVASAALGGN